VKTVIGTGLSLTANQYLRSVFGVKIGSRLSSQSVGTAIAQRQLMKGCLQALRWRAYGVTRCLDDSLRSGQAHRTVSARGYQHFHNV